MRIKRGLTLSLTTALFIALSTVAFALSEEEQGCQLTKRVLTFKPGDPEYYYASDYCWKSGLADKVACSSNNETGEVATYALAIPPIGASVAEAKQYIIFEVPYPGKVEVDATILYLSGTTKSGIAVDTTAVVWEIDDNADPDYRIYIDPPFDDEFIGNVILSIMTEILPGYAATAMEAIAMLGEISDASQLLNELNSCDEAKEYHLHFSFDASAGYHKVGVGVRSEAVAAGNSYACAVMAGVVKEIKVTFPMTIISEDELWDEYKTIENPVIVESGAKLTIAPGNSIKFYPDPDIVLCIEGTLEATGVNFTSSRGEPAPGDWCGIVFCGPSSNGSVLNNCAISYGGGETGANIKCVNSSPTIQNCTISHSSEHGIYIDFSSTAPTVTIFPTIKDGTTISDSAGHGIYIDSGSPTIEGCTVSNNGGYGIFGENTILSAAKVCDPDDYECFAANNALWKVMNPIIKDNVTENNAFGGIYCQPASVLQVQNALRGVPVLGDIDGDGKVEIVGGTLFRMYAWNEDGTQVSGWPKDIRNYHRGSPALGDIDGDERLEVVAFDSGGKKIYAWNGEDGTLLDGWPVDFPFSHWPYSPVLADLDGDNKDEIVFGPYILNENGDLILTLGLSDQPAVGDIDNDGDLEIVGWGGAVYHHDGSWVSGHWASMPQQLRLELISMPTLADLDADGDLEIIYGPSYHGLAEKKIHVLHHNGVELKGFPIDSNGEVLIGDVDGSDDGVPEIVAMEDNSLKAWNWKGESVLGESGLQLPPHNTAPLLADINGDNRVDIIAINGDKPEEKKVRAWDLQGNLIPGWPKSTSLWEPTAIAVSDIGSDGGIDIVAATAEIITWVTPTEGYPNAGPPKLFFWDLRWTEEGREALYNPDYVEWGMSDRDAAHTRAYRHVPPQYGTIAGKIMSDKPPYPPSEPVIGLTVEAIQGNIVISTITTSDGTYVISRLLEGDYTVKAGYKTEPDQTVTIGKVLRLPDWRLDVSPPNISHTPVKQAFVNKPLIVQAQVVDVPNHYQSTPAVEIAEVAVFYRKRGNQEYTKLVVTAENQGKVYVATIPASDVTEIGEGGIEYYLRAEDIVGNFATKPKTAPMSSPYKVEIVSQADLHPSQVTLSVHSNFLLVDTEFTITVKVDNIGAGDASDVVVKFFDGNPQSGGVQISTDQVIDFIPDGDSRTAHINWLAGEPLGEHIIHILVDPDDSISELDETNNQITHSVTFAANLMTDVKNATGLPNQRKLARDSQGTLHLVYPMGGEIYYTTSFDSGTTWQRAINLSNTAGVSETPSIAVDTEDNLYVVWSDADYVSGSAEDYAEILYRKFEGNSWSGTMNVSNTYNQSKQPSILVDSSGTPHVIFIDGYHHDFSLNGGMARYTRYDGSNWTSASYIHGMGFEAYPSLILDHNGELWAILRYGVPGFMGDIFYGIGFYKYDGATWQEMRTITAEFLFYDRPSVSVDLQGRLHVVWGEDDDWDSYGEKIYYSRYDSSWSEPLLIGDTSKDLSLSSISVDSQGQIYVLWTDYSRHSTGDIVLKKFDGSAWQQAEFLTDDTAGNTSPTLSCSGNRRVVECVWTQGTSSPYTLKYAMLVAVANQAPSAPQIDSPGDQSIIIKNPPILTVRNATDPDGDSLTYQFELYRDSDLSQLVAKASNIPQGIELTTSWEVDIQLPYNATYWWRARTYDGIALSDWTTPASFALVMPGDVSGNGVVNPHDALLVIKHVVGLSVFSQKQQRAADVSNNGTVTSYDAALIMQYLSGIINKFPIEL